MHDLKFIFILFGIVIYGIIILYYVSIRRGRNNPEYRESSTMVAGSMGYIIMLFYNVPVKENMDLLFYVFALISVLISFRLLNFNIEQQVVIPPKFYLSVFAFLALWVILAEQQDYGFIDIILPVILLQSIAYFFIGLIYLLHEDYEVSLRNLAGILFLLLNLVKIFYIFTIDVEHHKYIDLIFKVDFMIYILLIFVVVASEYTSHNLEDNNESDKLADTIMKMPIGMMRINTRGDIVSMNDIVKETLKFAEVVIEDEEIPNIHNITKLPLDEKWKDILKALDAGEIYSLEADFFQVDGTKRFEFILLPNKDQADINNTIFTCFVMSSGRYYSLLNTNDQDKEVVTIPNKYQLMELFEEGIHKHFMKKFGVILIKIVNYDSITNIVNAHETSTIDYLIADKISKLQFVYTIGKVRDNTFEIITKDSTLEGDIHDNIQYIKDILGHQSFYDNDMNVYNLDYRIGIAMAPNDGFTQRDLLHCATIAIAKATTQEKGYTQFFNEHIKDEVVSKLQLESKLRDGIIENQLYLEYQPQFGTKTGVIRGFEALVRWRVDDSRILMPNEFITVAEELGIIDELGDWVIRKAIKEGLKWNTEYNQQWILSINISVGQLEHEGFADSVIKIIDDMNYIPKLLELEVTETKMVRSSDRAFLELNKLHKYGVKIAIDDFGTGYSSLDYLRLLPFDLLKIDKAFVQRITDNDIDLKIIEGIMDLASKLEIESVAEGVETKEQLEFLQNTSCNFIQGYIFSKPMSSDAVIDLIEESLE